MPDPTPCPTCGSPLQDGAKFCGTCGNATGPTPAVPGPDEPTEAVPAADDPWAPGPPEAGDASDGPDEEPPLLGPQAEPPPGGWGAPLTPGGTMPAGEAFAPTAAQPPVSAAPLPPTIADQAAAAAGEGPGAPPPGGPSGPGGPGGPGGPDDEHPRWMPDPSQESRSSRTGLFVVLGVAGGVLLTLIALLLVLVLDGGDDEEVSTDTTTTSTTEPETTTTEAPTTTTTEAPTTTTTQAPSTTTTAAGGSTVPLAALEVGDCVTNDVSASLQDDFDVVDCDAAHRAELFAVADLPAGPYPSGNAGNPIIEQRCLGDTFTDYVGVDYQSSSIWVTGVFPDEQTWNAGTRTIHCFGHEQDASDTFTGTIRDSNR